MKNAFLLLSTALLLAVIGAAGSYAADSEEYIGKGSEAPAYQVKHGEHGETELKRLVEDAETSDAEAMHHADEGQHAEGGLPQLDFSTYPSQIFWLFIAFTLLYFIFSKKTLPEISSTIENRREQVEGDLENASRLKEEAEEVHTAYEDILADARHKASEEFTKVEDKIKKATAKKLDAFKERASEQTSATEKLVADAKKEAIGDMHSIAAEVASAAAKKIVGVSTDLDQAKTLVKNIDRKAA